MAWRGAVGGAGAVEVGQDVGGSFGQGLCQGLDLLQPVGDGLSQGVDEPLHQVLSQARVLGAVGLEPGAGRRSRRPGPQRGDHQRTGSRDAWPGRR